MTISAVVPLAHKKYLDNILKLVKYEQIKQIVVLNSTGENIEPSNKKIFVVEERNFNHGRTRNKGAELANGDILLFTVQDAYPYNDDFANEIVKSINGCVKATYGQHVPNCSNIFEVIERTYMYPSRAILKTYKHRMRFEDFFVSNVCLAVERKTFMELGGFPDDIPCSEELILSIKILSKGYKILYNPNIKVVHFHDEGFLASLKRWFNVGMAFSDYPQIKVGFIDYAMKVIWHELGVLTRRYPHLLPAFFLRVLTRELALESGKLYRLVKQRIAKQKFGVSG